MSRVKIGLIDYGIGYIKSVYLILKNLDYEIVFLSNFKYYYEIDKILLVGVGVFNNLMKNLYNLGFVDYIKYHIEKGKHFLVFV